MNVLRRELSVVCQRYGYVSRQQLRIHQPASEYWSLLICRPAVEQPSGVRNKWSQTRLNASNSQSAREDFEQPEFAD